MPCDTTQTLTEYQRAAQDEALRDLERALGLGTVRVQVGAQGAVAFEGWREEDRAGLYDLCAYRKLSATNSPELRQAVMRAEALAGNKVNEQTIAAGVHSHDGGKTWNAGH